MALALKTSKLFKQKGTITMAISRTDLATKQGLYRIPNLDGRWKVHSYSDSPTIQIHNIDTGELKTIEMTGVENMRSQYVRSIEPDDKIEPIKGAVIVEKAPEPSADGVKLQEQVETLTLMLNDALELSGRILEKDRPNKETRDQLESWKDQVTEYLN